MRAAVLAAALACALGAGGGRAAAEPLPPGSIGMVVGAVSGTGADASRLGFGYHWGGQAAWQPMSTEQRIGWAARWSFVFGTMYEAQGASVGDELVTLQMDFLLGARIRLGANPGRYLALRAGGELLRLNQTVPPKMQRAFAGAVASVGVDQYAFGFLFNVDVRLSQIGTGPTILAFMFGAGKTGP